MTTSQTIDGVPRELAERFAQYAESGKVAEPGMVEELRALLDAPEPCAHDWTDDGEYLIVCTKCGTQENHDPQWRDMANAPTDGTMVRLLVDFDEHPTGDADQAATIGANNLDNDGEDAWRFAGWCWTHDHFTQGTGTPVGWLPMLADPVVTPAAQPQGEPVAWVWVDEKGEHDVTLRWDVAKHLPYFVKPLYAEQPAPVAVVLPERYDESQYRGTSLLAVRRWNACLDELKRLNPSL